MIITKGLLIDRWTRGITIGDSIKHDILGANHSGMASALIHGRAKPELVTPTFVFVNFFEATKVLLD